MVNCNISVKTIIVVLTNVRMQQIGLKVSFPSDSIMMSCVPQIQFHVQSIIYNLWHNYVAMYS